MNDTIWTTYREYLDRTGEASAAAALTLADALQGTLDAKVTDALPPADKALLTVPEVAKRLHLSRRKVYAMCRLGDLSIVKAGRAVRIPAAEIDRFAAGSRAEVAPPFRPNRHGL